MTANHEHTPSQEMFRLAYKHILDNWLITPEGRQQALGEYDRMIAQVEAAAEQRGAARELRKFAHAQDTWCAEGRAEQRISRIAMRDALLKRANELERADQEGGSEQV